MDYHFALLKLMFLNTWGAMFKWVKPPSIIDGDDDATVLEAGLPSSASSGWQRGFLAARGLVPWMR
jgi:hypothetical protein